MIQSITISDCVGPYSQCVLKGDILQCIDHAKRLGYEGVEMHMRNAKPNDYNRIKDYQYNISEAALTVSLFCCCIL